MIYCLILKIFTNVFLLIPLLGGVARFPSWEGCPCLTGGVGWRDGGGFRGWGV